MKIKKIILICTICMVPFSMLSCGLNFQDDYILEVKENTNMLTITYKKGKNNLEELIDYLKKNKINYNKIFSERPTLNDVFLELTGKELRD